MHIHIDANDFDIKQWRNIYKNYAIFETVIDSFMPQSRRDDNNQYCRSLKRQIPINQLFEKIDSCRTVAEIASKVTNNSRYYKINAQSFARHGSIEFRQHSGTVEYEKIMNWLIFLHNLVSYSEKNVSESGDFEKLTNTLPAEIYTYLAERREDLSN